MIRFNDLVRRGIVFGALALAGVAQAAPVQIGSIVVCYACQNSGNTAIDAALAANPSVAGDGLAFGFTNTSTAAITGAVFSVTYGSGIDSFSLPTLAAGATTVFLPGLDNDGGVHPAGGLFSYTGYTTDTSDGAGGVTDASIFKFTGLLGTAAVTSTTAGTSTAIAGTFTAGDPGLFKPYRDNPSYQTSFLGNGPNGDGGCNNCYFGTVATLTVPGATVGGVPEPAAWALLVTGFGLVGAISRQRRAVVAA